MLIAFLRRFLQAAVLAGIITALFTSIALADTGPMGPPKEIDRSTKFIEEDLLCQCGCTMGVADCDCSTADDFRKTIATMMGEGKTKDQIIASFVAQYGEKVLMAPTKKGFNLSAWIMPFAALLIGLAVVGWLVWNWVLRFRKTAAAQPVLADGPETLTEDDKPYLEEIQDILRRHY